MTENVALLLVDDRPENLVALEAVLGNQGLDLIKAASGNDALRHTLKRDFALVLLDVQMPGMDGFETAELMRSNPKTRQLPIIFVTAGMKDIQLQFKGYELGAVDYLIKPFEPHILQSKVKVFCELYRQRRQLEANQLLLESKIRERVSQLRESEERFHMLATHAPVGIYQIDTEGNCLFVNRRWCEIAGLSADETAGQGWTRTIHPDDRDAVAAIWRGALSPDGEWSMDYRFLRPDGKIIWVNGNAIALCNEKGEITGYLGNNLEITARKRGEERQRMRSAVTGQLAENATLPGILHLIAVDAERQVHGMTCAILLLDEPGQQLVYGAAPNLPDLVSRARTSIGDGAGATCAATANHGKRHIVDDIRTHPACEDCQPPAVAGVPVSCWSEPILAINGEVLGVFAFYWAQPTVPDAGDIELMHEAVQLAGLAIERKRTAETIWQHANYDSLTKLPNRRLFRDRLQQEILKAQRAGLYVALLFVDLDRFKEVNDTLGHHAGDLLLIEAARRVRDCVRATDTVARLGGDEFTVIMSNLADTDRVGEIAQAMLLALATPFVLDAEMVYVSASIGITIFPGDADNVESLLKNADQAMYAAKEQGRNRFSYFTASMQAIAQTRLMLCNDLRNAIAAGQLEVYLQPIMELATGRIFKAEALLRWRHPTHGMVGPAQFIPIAEETGLINEIGDWVFREAARTAKRWYDAGLLEATDDGLIQISVNKSPRQFFSGNTHETWIDYLKEIGLPAKCIAIEITEGLLLDDRPEVAAKLKQFRDAGFRVSLDDFGTGYSAMSYLKKFPLDFLKIDQSFVRDMATDHGDQAIVEAIIVMAHKLGLKVIAEGVETLEQCEILKAAGCDYGQGYLFARPMPAAEMILTT
ncbi:MAG: EAL domain-containing protein [Rhodocyclaceae bacterium]|nr:EAL domain-containing protein [Rhodocyclaceae bacterium]